MGWLLGLSGLGGVVGDTGAKWIWEVELGRRRISRRGDLGAVVAREGDTARLGGMVKKLKINFHLFSKEQNLGC